MRIIDADYVIEKLNEINGTAELDKAFEVVENAPTVDVLDKIKGEIFNACSDNYHMPVYKLSCEEIFEIIDKYR